MCRFSRWHFQPAAVLGPGAIAEELIKEVKIGGSLGCSDHALVEFMISRNVGLVKNGVRSINFRKSNLWLFKELLDEIS